MPTVRTTMRPFEEIEVSAIEAADLARQGLLVSEAPSASATEPQPAQGSATTKKAPAAVAATKEG